MRTDKSKIWVRIIFVFVLALVLRWGFLAIFGQPQARDSGRYRQLATNLLVGRGFSTIPEEGRPVQGFLGGSLFSLPAYPVFLMIWQVVCKSRGEMCAMLFQGFLGAMTAVFTFLLARKFLSLSCSVLAGVLFAVDWVQIYLANCVLTEALFTFFLAAFILLSLQDVWRNRVLGVLGLGSILSLAILAKGNGLFCAPVFLIYLLFAPSSQRLWRRLTLACCFLLPLAISTQLWCYRNYRTEGYYGLSAIGGYGLLMKTMKFSPIESDKFSENERTVANTIVKSHGSYYAAAEIFYNERGWSFADTNKVYQRMAQKIVADHPIRYAEYSMFAFINCFLSPSLLAATTAMPPIGWRASSQRFRENIAEHRYAAAAVNLGLRVLLVFVFFFLLPLGGWWLWRQRPDLRPEQVLLWSYALLMLMFIAVMANGEDRYRTPLDPILLLFVAAGICRLLRWSPQPASGQTEAAAKKS